MAWSSYHAALVLEGVRAALRWALPWESALAGLTCGGLLCLEGLLLAWALRDVARGRGVGGLSPNGEHETSPHGESDGCIELALAKPCGPIGVSFKSNALQPQFFETEACTGKILLLHKPTADPHRMRSGAYPYGGHMHGRKRNFEVRIQLTFKDRGVQQEGQMYFGCQLDRYCKIGACELYLGQSINGMLRKIANGMHQSYGDDPERVAGEPEVPCNVYPLWVMDQLIVTPPGEALPDLCCEEFPTLGMIKINDRRKMREVLDALEFKPGVTYTFGFWCVSQFVDGIGWKATLGGSLDVSLSKVGTPPPAYLTMYFLKPRDQWTNVQGDRDHRHLESRKVYIFRCALWSSLHPPHPSRVKELTVAGAADECVEPPEPKGGRSCCDPSA